MKKLLIFAGTTEGRTFAQRVARSRAGEVFCDVCVATEYGEQTMSEEEGIRVMTGRLSADEMEELMRKNCYMAAVDATHPFATEVTENIFRAAKAAGVACYRLEREIRLLDETEENVIYCGDIEECIEVLSQLEGKILLTTGSKDLRRFMENESVAGRVIARILPGLESIKLAYESGLDGKSIIAMQGPFSLEMNENLIREYQIKVLVTKASGSVGGMEEKLLAAKNCGITCVVIRKPGQQSEIVGHTADEIYDLLFGPEYPVSVSLVGIGMGSRESATLAAQEAIEQADVLFGAQRMIDSAVQNFHIKGRTFPYYLNRDILPQLAICANEEKREIRAAVLFSGDTGFFSGAEKLLAGLGACRNITARVLNGSSSLSYFAAKIGVSWQDARIISAHGTAQELWIPQLRESAKTNQKTFFLTSGVEDIHTIGRMLEEDCPDAALHLGYELSYPGEKIRKLKPCECREITEKGLYVGMIVNVNAKAKTLTPGIADDAFVRDKVPMTKEEVREISICKLHLRGDSIVYDIGSGTGSIAVEAARLSAGIRVYAVETNPVAVELIGVNKEKFGCENITVVQALAPDGLAELPAATHAFIGGSKGNLKEILLCLREKNPAMRIVMNAVSMETVAESQQVLTELGISDADIALVNVSKAKKLGAYHLMQANNPVYVISFDLSGGRG